MNQPRVDIQDRQAPVVTTRQANNHKNVVVRYHAPSGRTVTKGLICTTHTQTHTMREHQYPNTHCGWHISRQWTLRRTMR